MCVPLKALFLVSTISNPENNIFFQVYRLKGGLPYNTDCFSYWQGTIQASYAVMRQLLFHFTNRNLRTFTMFVSELLLEINYKN